MPAVHRSAVWWLHGKRKGRFVSITAIRRWQVNLLVFRSEIGPHENLFNLRITFCAKVDSRFHSVARSFVFAEIPKLNARLNAVRLRRC